MVFAKAEKVEKEKDNSHSDRAATSTQEATRLLHRLVLAGDPDPQHPEAASSISSGLSIVGKIIGRGALTIFGQVEGELRASIVVIAEGAEIVGDVVAEELTVNGHVKGTIHANCVRLGATGVVEGDILHRTLVIEENARFEGASRRNKNAIEAQSFVQANRPQAQTTPIEGKGNGDGASDNLDPVG